MTCYFLNKLSVWQVFGELADACAGTHTELVYKTEEAAHGKREDLAEHWQSKGLDSAMTCFSSGRFR